MSNRTSMELKLGRKTLCQREINWVSMSNRTSMELKLVSVEQYLY